MAKWAKLRRRTPWPLSRRFTPTRCTFGALHRSGQVLRKERVQRCRLTRRIRCGHPSGPAKPAGSVNHLMSVYNRIIAEASMRILFNRNSSVCANITSSHTVFRRRGLAAARTFAASALSSYNTAYPSPFAPEGRKVLPSFYRLRRRKRGSALVDSNSLLDHASSPHALRSLTLTRKKSKSFSCPLTRPTLRPTSCPTPSYSSTINSSTSALISASPTKFSLLAPTPTPALACARMTLALPLTAKSSTTASLASMATRI